MGAIAGRKETSPRKQPPPAAAVCSSPARAVSSSHAHLGVPCVVDALLPGPDVLLPHGDRGLLLVGASAPVGLLHVPGSQLEKTKKSKPSTVTTLERARDNLLLHKGGDKTACHAIPYYTIPCVSGETLDGVDRSIDVFCLVWNGMVRLDRKRQDTILEYYGGI